MDLDGLRVFLVVAERGSIQKAARDLSLARSTVRRRLEALEESTGVGLLHRTRTGVVLTEAGRQLSVRGRPLLDQTTALLSRIRDVRDEPLRHLRVGVPLGVPAHLPAAAVATIRGLLPQATFAIRPSEDPLALLPEDADMIAHYGPHTPPGPWLSVEVFAFRAQILGSPAYLERHGVPRTVAELASHTLFSWSGTAIDPHRWPLSDGTRLSVEPLGISTDPRMLRQLVAGGLGLALLPDGNVVDPAYPDLVRVLDDEVSAPVGLRLVVPELTVDHPGVTVVFNALKQLVR